LFTKLVRNNLVTNKLVKINDSLILSLNENAKGVLQWVEYIKLANRINGLPINIS